METKTSIGYTVKARPQGQVEAVFSVAGVLDAQSDIVHPGAFVDTFRERGSKVRVLDQHKLDSVLDVIGKVMELRELGRSELPGELVSAYPDATGGALAKIQYMLDDDRSAGAFARAREGLSSWSFGFDAVKVDHSTETGADGKRTTVRNLRQLILWEVSQCIFPANEATMTAGVKSLDRDLRREFNHLRDEIERLEYGGYTRHELLAEIYKLEVEISML